MKRYRKHIASGLIAMMTLLPLASVADTYRYRYAVSLDTVIAGDGGGGETTPTNPDDEYQKYVTDWEPVGDLYDCEEYTPLAETVPSGVRFTQTAINCSGDEERQIITYKMEDGNEIPTIIGEPVTETRTATGLTATQNAVGTKTEFSIFLDYDKITTGEVFIGWQSNGAINYKIKGSSNASGVSTSYVDQGKRSYVVLNADPGTYTYTIQATNDAGETTEAQAQVEVVDFAIKNFVVQESEVAPGQDMHLSWEAPEGADLYLVGYGDVTGLSSIVVPAPNGPGSTFWSLSANKVFNGTELSVGAYSNTFQILAAPYIYENVLPKVGTVFATGNNFWLNWASTSDVTKYTLESDNPNSGVPTSPIEVATNVKANAGAKYSVVPVSGEYGKYTYTIKGYNKVGAVGELKITVTAVPYATIYYISADRSDVSPGDYVTLNWSVIGAQTFTIKNQATKEVVYSGTGSGADYANSGSVTVPVGNTPGNVYWDANVVGFNSNSAYTSPFTYVVADPVLNITPPTDDVHLGNKFRVDTQIENAATVTLTGSSAESGWPTVGTPESGYGSYYEGTPTASGDYSYTIKVTNRAGKSVSKGFMVHVLPW